MAARDQMLVIASRRFTTPWNMRLFCCPEWIDKNYHDSKTAASDLSLLFVSKLLERKTDQTSSVFITFQSKNGNAMPCFGFHATSVLQTIQNACPTFQNKGLNLLWTS